MALTSPLGVKLNWKLPAAPSDLTGGLLYNVIVVLSWQDNSNNETEFRIYMRWAGGAYSLLGTASGDSGPWGEDFLANNLDEDTQYYFQVQACNPAGCSAFSNEVGIVTGHLN
jgi:hypothetical protein